MFEYCESCRNLNEKIKVLLSETDKLSCRIEYLAARLDDYRIQSAAAMKADSLGLCKAALKHAILDDKGDVSNRNVSNEDFANKYRLGNP